MKHYILILLMAFCVNCSSSLAETQVPESTMVDADIPFDSTMVAVESTDIQSALAEIQPKLSSFIVGTWDVNFITTSVWTDNEDSSRYMGKITFGSGGTVSISDIPVDNRVEALSALLEGWDLSLKDVVKTYEIFAEMIIQVRFQGSSKLANEYRVQYWPLVITKSNENNMVIVYEGDTYLLTRI